MRKKLGILFLIALVVLFVWHIQTNFGTSTCLAESASVAATSINHAASSNDEHAAPSDTLEPAMKEQDVLDSPKLTMISADPGQMEISFSLGDYQVKNLILDDGREYVDVVASQFGGGEDAWRLAEIGKPALPVYAVNFAALPNREYSVTVTDVHWEHIQNVRPLPSPGLLMGSQVVSGNLPKLVENPEIYGGTKKYPAATAKILGEFQIRDLAYQQLQITPFQYDAANDEILVCTEAVIIVTAMTDDMDVMTDEVLEYDANSQFAEIQSDLAFNASIIQDSRKKAILRGASAVEPGSVIGNMLLIVPNEWAGVEHDFVAWKRQMGYAVRVARYPDDTGQGVDSLQKFIKDVYDKESISHLMILGDSDDVPSKTLIFGASQEPEFQGLERVFCSDVPYVLTSGDDCYPDIMMSRLSVESFQRAASELNKLMLWEDGGSISDRNAQANQGIFLASNVKESASIWGNLADWEKLDNYIKPLEESGLIDCSNAELVQKIYYGKVADNNSTCKKYLKSALERGASVMMYMGHGSPDSFTTSQFSSDDAKRLTREFALSYLVAPVCLCGDFDSGSDCLAEAFFRTEKENCGAAAVIASVEEVFWDVPDPLIKKFVELRQGASDFAKASRACSVGQYFLNSIAEAIKFCAATTNPNGDTIGTAAFCANELHLFGDASQMTRMAKFMEPKINCEFDEDLDVLTVRVRDDADNAVGMATVSVFYHDEFYAAGLTDGNGKVEFQFNDATNADNISFYAISPELPMTAFKCDVLNRLADATTDEEKNKIIDAWRQADFYDSDLEPGERYELHVNNKPTKRCVVNTNDLDYAMSVLSEGQFDIESINQETGNIVVYAAPADVSALGLSVSAKSSIPRTDMSVGPKYDELVDNIQSLCADNWPIARPFKIGQSMDGRDIVGVEIAEDISNDCAEEILIVSGIFGCDRDAVLESWNKICDFVSAPSQLGGRHVYILPCLNPDGYEVGSRCNANNVALNAIPPAIAEELPSGFGALQPEVANLLRWCLADHHFTSIEIMATSPSVAQVDLQKVCNRVVNGEFDDYVTKGQYVPGMENDFSVLLPEFVEMDGNFAFLTVRPPFNWKVSNIKIMCGGIDVARAIRRSSIGTWQILVEIPDKRMEFCPELVVSVAVPDDGADYDAFFELEICRKNRQPVVKHAYSLPAAKVKTKLNLEDSDEEGTLRVYGAECYLPQNVLPDGLEIVGWNVKDGAYEYVHAMHQGQAYFIRPDDNVYELNGWWVDKNAASQFHDLPQGWNLIAPLWRKYNDRYDVYCFEYGMYTYANEYLEQYHPIWIFEK